MKKIYNIAVLLTIHMIYTVEEVKSVLGNTTRLENSQEIRYKLANLEVCFNKDTSDYSGFRNNPYKTFSSDEAKNLYDNIDGLFQPQLIEEFALIKQVNENE